MKRRSGGTRGSEDDVVPTLSLPTSFSIDPNFPHPTLIVPSTTITEYQSTETRYATITTGNPTPQTESSSGLSTVTTTAPGHLPTGMDHYPTNRSQWERWDGGVKGGVMAAAVVVALIIIALGIWFCCGGKRKWRSATKQEDGTTLPLHTVIRNCSFRNRPQEQQAAAGGDAPPPRYEEVVPNQHQRLAGGIAHATEEDDGVVADGKTPLSEIPFEDVVLDSTPSESSSSRSFAERHHHGPGNTTGHTNS